MFCVKMDVTTVPAIEPLLPMVVGPISSLVMDLRRGARTSFDGPLDVDGADHYGLDLQLALYACYELHYRGFAGVSGSLGMGSSAARPSPSPRAGVPRRGEP
jgi:hypothetical protein